MVGSHISHIGILAHEIMQVGRSTAPVTNDKNRRFADVLPIICWIDEQTLISSERPINQVDEKGNSKAEHIPTGWLILHEQGLVQTDGVTYCRW